jgi:hypothetical protein
LCQEQHGEARHFRHQLADNFGAHAHGEHWHVYCRPETSIIEFYNSSQNGKRNDVRYRRQIEFPFLSIPVGSTFFVAFYRSNNYRF